MINDFYLNKIAQAAYFEKDWFDHVEEPARFSFAPFAIEDLYSPFHERLAEFVARNLKDSPIRMLEIGSSTGRTFYELCTRLASIRQAILVEPSLNLAEIHSKIFGLQLKPKDVEYFPALRGNVELTEVRMEIGKLRRACAHVDMSLLHKPHEELPELGVFDLVVCSNVLDQCHEPLRLVEYLKRATTPGGTLALTCTYQWQEKFRGLPAIPIRHVDELFEKEWRIVDETNIPFHVRTNERHWKRFLSHVCLLTR